MRIKTGGLAHFRSASGLCVSPCEQFLVYCNSLLVGGICLPPIPFPKLKIAQITCYSQEIIWKGIRCIYIKYQTIMLNSMLEGDAHYEHPFEVGFPLKGRRFVHVVDEMTVDALLEELDTVPDLVDYLACKERYFGANDVFMHVAGEEELLARYMCTMEEDRDREEGELFLNRNNLVRRRSLWATLPPTCQDPLRLP